MNYVLYLVLMVGINGIYKLFSFVQLRILYYQEDKWVINTIKFSFVTYIS